MLDFVSAYNPAGEHHIGYFGVTPEDIRQSILMLNLRYDRSFYLAVKGYEITGVMGADIDKEIGRAWLYGPVVVADGWESTADRLYSAVQKAIPAQITEHEMFVDARNLNCQAFAGRHAFETHGGIAIFYIVPDKMAILPVEVVEEWDSRFTDQFVALHDRLFPRSNYTLNYMLEEYRRGALFNVIADGDTLAGYFFGRAEEASGEAYVDLIGVDEAYRRNGIGRRLLLAGLTRLRGKPGLRQVNLTVDLKNEAAIRLYHSLGFEKERDMVAFRKNVGEVI